MNWFRPGGSQWPREQLTEAEILAKAVAAIIQDETLMEPLDLDRFNTLKGRIYCYKEADGSCPARAFLDDLPNSASKSYATAFTTYCNGQRVRGIHHHIWEDYELLGEYKHRQTKTRIMHTYERNFTHVLLFGFGSKTENKVDNEHVNRAIKMQQEYKRRRDEIEARIRKECGVGGKKRG